MMKSMVTSIVRKLGVTVVLVMAVVACVSATSASAAGSPRWVWETVFTINLGGEGEISFETANATKVKCKGSNGALGSPVITGGTESLGEGPLHLYHCTTSLGGECTSKEASAGEINLTSMNLRLAYLTAGSKEAGLILNYHKSGEVTTFSTFTCTIFGIAKKFAVRGNALAKVTPINVLTSVWTLSLKGAAGVPELTEYLNEAGTKVAVKLEEEVDGKGWEQANIVGAPTINANLSEKIQA
jgi:hypothetical protein